MKDVSVDYIANEEACQRKPVELYHVWEDGGNHWRYTDGDVSVTFDGDTYTPATLSRSSTKYDTQLEVSTLQIDASFVSNPVLEFIAINPIEVLWVSISKLHRDQSPLEADVIFIGQIKNVSFKGIAARVTCVGFEHFLKQTVPKWRYQLTCNHILFDDKCTKIATGYKTTAVVTLNSTKIELTSVSFAALADGYFIGGKVVFGNETRTIVNHVTSVITLMYKFKELEDSDSVDAYPGCDGRIETCRDKYDNILNFLGFPFIPMDNPGTRVM
jgi:uncharacterized phage protein (TIGR02218 family)